MTWFTNREAPTADIKEKGEGCILVNPACRIFPTAG